DRPRAARHLQRPQAAVARARAAEPRRPAGGAVRRGSGGRAAAAHRAATAAVRGAGRHGVRPPGSVRPVTAGLTARGLQQTLSYQTVPARGPPPITRVRPTRREGGAPVRSDATPCLTYCEGWDPWSRRAHRPLPASVARERDRRGEQYTMLLTRGGTPTAVLDVA